MSFSASEERTSMLVIVLVRLIKGRKAVVLRPVVLLVTSLLPSGRPRPIAATLIAGRTMTLPLPAVVRVVARPTGRNMPASVKEAGAKRRAKASHTLSGAYRPRDTVRYLGPTKRAMRRAAAKQGEFLISYASNLFIKGKTILPCI